MSIARQDTFARAAVASGWGTASDGNLWAIVSGNGQSVASNEGIISGSSASTFATLGANLPTADAEGLVRITISTGNSNPTAGILLRWTDSNNHWLARFNGATGTWNLMVKQSGTYTSLTPTFNANIPGNGPYWLRFRAQGTTLSFKVWKDGTAEPGTWSVSLTDTRQNVIGKVGLYGYADGSPGTYFDGFVVDDLVTGSTQNASAGATAGGSAALTAASQPAGVAMFASAGGAASLTPTAKVVAGASPAAGASSALVPVNGNAAPGTGPATLTAFTRTRAWTGGIPNSPGTEYDFKSLDSTGSGWYVGGIPTYGGMPVSTWSPIDANVEGVQQTSLATTAPDGWVHWLEQDTAGAFAGSENPTWTKTDLDVGGPNGLRAYYRATANANDALGFQWKATVCIYPGDPGFIAFRFDLTNPSATAKALSSSDSLEIALIAGLQQSDGTWDPTAGGSGVVGGITTSGWPSTPSNTETDYVYITPASGKNSGMGLVNVKKTKLGAGGLGWSGVQLQYLQNTTRLKVKIMGSYTSFPAGATQTFYCVNALKRGLTQADAIAIAADYLTPGTPSGSAFTGFSYDERAYQFTATGNAVTTTFDLSASTVSRRYKPVLKVSNWASPAAPTLTWGGSQLQNGVDYQYTVDATNKVLYVQLAFDIVKAASGNAGERLNAQLVVADTSVKSADLNATGNASATLLPTSKSTVLMAAQGGGNAVCGPNITAPAIPDNPPGGYRVVHAGQDITDYVDEFSIDITSVLGQGPGSGAGGSGQGTTCTFKAYLGPAAKAIGKTRPPSGTDIVRQGSVDIYDAQGAAVFGGFLTKLDDVSESINAITQFNCVDGWQHLDRIEVFELYTGKSDTFIFRDLCQKYAPWVDLTLLPATDNYVFERRACKGTLRAALQSIANTTGWYVWMDPGKALHYVAPTQAQTAPFELSDDANSVTTFPHQLTKFEVDDNAIINRVYFYGGKNTSPDFIQDLSNQANGTNKVFLLAYAPENATDGQKHIVLNGLELSVGSVFDTSTSGKLKSDGGSSDVLLNAGSKVAIFDVAPQKTDTLYAKYRYQTPLVIVLSNQQSFNFYGDWFDGRIVDSNVFDVHNALQRCRVLLAEQSYGLIQLEATVWKAGLQAGQLLRIFNSIRGLDDSYLIQKVKVVPLGGGEFEYHISCGAWNWNLLDILIQGARILNPTDGNSEEDMTVIQAREAVLVSTVTIAITKSTAPSGQYYSGQPGTLSGFFTVTG